MAVEVKKQAVTTAQAEQKAIEKAKQLSFKNLIKAPAVQKSLMESLGDALKVKEFTTAIIATVNTSKDLQNCEGNSIISAALYAESHKLSFLPQLGQAYLVPFRDGKEGVMKATLIIGWRGYYQLALRSGWYKSIEITPVKEGELISHNPFTGECELKALDDAVRDSTRTIGYYAYFELLNGFKKSMYWSKEKMEAHALKYSKGYKAKSGYTYWEKDFDEMALKTMVRQLVGRYGIMSTEMQSAYSNDMTVQPDITLDTDEEPEEPIYFDAETGELIDE